MKTLKVGTLAIMFCERAVIVSSIKLQIDDKYQSCTQQQLSFKDPAKYWRDCCEQNIECLRLAESVHYVVPTPEQKTINKNKEQIFSSKNTTTKQVKKNSCHLECFEHLAAVLFD